MTPASTAEQMPATVREWTDILARIRFGTVKVAGKNYAGARIKGIASRLADYADSDGTRVRPGIVRLALDVEVTYRTARDIVAFLRWVGLLQLVRAGGRVRADEFRLTLPVDLLDRDDLEVWSPSRQTVEIRRAQEAHRGAGKAASRAPVHAPEDSAIPGGVHAPEDSALPADPNPIAESSGTAKSGIAESSGTRLLSPQGHATDQDLYTTTTDQPSEDLRTAVTATRAPEPATPEFSTRPKRCPHGLTGAHRGDGRPACALCRIAEDRPATAPSPPPGEQHLAPVIPLPAQEAS